MAEDNHNSWVEYDIAIEVIGKMIAEQIESLNELLDSFNRMGFKAGDEAILNDQAYRQRMQQIAFFKAEIDSIYSEKDITALLSKVQNVYAPYIKARMQLQKTRSMPQSLTYETV